MMAQRSPAQRGCGAIAAAAYPSNPSAKANPTTAGSDFCPMCAIILRA
jgi:hypothetical protein